MTVGTLTITEHATSRTVGLRCDHCGQETPRFVINPHDEHFDRQCALLELARVYRYAERIEDFTLLHVCPACVE